MSKFSLRKTSHILLVIMLSFVFTGCALDKAYRPNVAVACKVKPENLCSDSSIQIHNQGTGSEYSLGFVEINDQGQFRDERKQLNALIKALESTPSDEPLIISVFVHGWHHNAKEGDKNINDFKDSLAKLAKAYTAVSKVAGIKRKVFGVYVGWRGDSIDVEYLNELTFWDRKNTAENVGQVALSELLLRLEKVKNERNVPGSDGEGRNRLAIIGHSFGGAAVYQSTAQIMASRFMLSGQNGDKTKTIKGIGDLVVLINPAFEAIKFAPLFDLAQAQCVYEVSQKPKLVILTSENDGATKTLFPMGRFFSTLFEKHGEVKRNDCGLPVAFGESKADNTSVGHFEPLITHQLKLADSQSKTISSKSLSTFKDAACKNWPAQKNGESVNFGTTDLISLGKTVERNPYLNIRVDSEIIPNHNDIFGGALLQFIQLTTFAATEPECGEK